MRENQKVGIDRVLLKNLNIEQIDTQLLKQKGFIVIQDNENNIRIFKDGRTGKDVKINYIKVSKKHNKELLLINELRIGRLETKTAMLQKVDYEHLDVTLPKGLSPKRINDKNINTLEELKKALAEIEKELKELGFGKIDLLDTEIKEIEINANIKLNKPFNEYERVLDYINSLLPNRLKKGVNAKYKADDIYTGFKAGNDSITLKAYDKKENIRKKTGIEIEGELLRLEYSLLGEQKIKDILNTNKLKEIDFTLLDEAYKSLFNDDVVKKIYKDIDRQINHAKRQIQAYRKGTGGISAIDKYLKNYQANLLDIEIVLGALKELDKNGHFSRQAKKAIKSATEIEGITLFGNISKLNEILEQLGYEKIDIKMTKGIEKEVKKHY